MNATGDLADRVRLRDVVAADLPVFFEQQLDPTANYMAAFTVKDPRDREAFDERWDRILSDETNTVRTILFDGQVAGNIATHRAFGEPEVAYWLGKEFWGQGIATQALFAFLQQITDRPLYARAATDNVGSLRVLEKCGFVISGYDKGYANARGEEVEEVILKLT